MIETSGHGAMKENYCLDDGAYIAVKIIIEAVRRRLSGGKGISDLLSELREPLEEKEVRLKITCDDFKAYGGDVLEQLKEAVGSMKGYTPVDVNYEGYRVNRDEGDGKRGWFPAAAEPARPGDGAQSLNLRSRAESTRWQRTSSRG